jgi:hypothetical protein
LEFLFSGQNKSFMIDHKSNSLTAFKSKLLCSILLSALKGAGVFEQYTGIRVKSVEIRVHHFRAKTKNDSVGKWKLLGVFFNRRSII